MRSEDVRAALRRKFCAPEYALFYEVGDATGGRHSRWADAVAMGLWPSRGLYLQGFEIKVSRSDWLSEMRNPAKAEAIAQYCHQWWIVAPPGIVKDDELPAGWGLYEVKGNGLARIKQAPPLEAKPISMPFLAALLRRADEHARSLVRSEVAKETAALRESVNERVRKEVDEHKERLRSGDQAARDTLEAIKKAADAPGVEDGLFRRYFDAEGFGRAVGLVHRLGVTKTYGGLREIEKRLEPLTKMGESIRQLLGDLDADEQEAA